MNKKFRDFIVKDQNKIKPIPCQCGSSIRLITSKDNSLVNLHLTHITNSKKHYHRNCTEIYYILEGEGKLELSGKNVVNLKPGIVVMIKPEIPHRGYGNFTALIIGVPALQKDDEFFIP